MSDILASYTFLPWLRQGIVSKIRRQDSLGAVDVVVQDRASVRIFLDIKSDLTEGDPISISNLVQLVGPGDIIGVSSRAIVRTEPRNWVTDFEPNYLAFIEFYKEDFCWCYTPASAVQVDDGSPVDDPQQTKLRPWLFLMVLEEEEFESGASLDGPLETVTFSNSADPAAIFPPPDQTWGWAHVHVSKDITGGNTRPPQQTVDALEDLIRQNPDEAVSRLVCPRKLRPNKGYHAFLIPAFEVGRLAGLGLPTKDENILAPSWGDGQTQYPVYYRWYFRTGERGDFEYLVNLLEARPVDERVGIRDMDMQAPNFDVPGMIDGPNDEPVMGLEGALKSPQAQPQPAKWPPADPDDHPPFLTELAAKVNLQETLLDPDEPDGGHPDPIISPPLYGRWHALQKKLNVGQDGWVNELNQDPRFRTPAGSGTEVIQGNQVTYMQKAWQQIGDLPQVNRKIFQVQVALAASHRVYIKNLLPLDDDQRMAITGQLHSRIMGSPTTVFSQVNESQLPGVVLTPAFRRLTRPRGALMRKAVPESQGKFTDVISQLNEGDITAAPPKTAPENQISLDEASGDLVPDWVPDWLKDLLSSPLTRWIILALMVLFLLLVIFFPPAVVLALAALAALGFSEWLRRRIQASERLKEDNLTEGAVDAVPPRSGFAITEPGDNLPSGINQIGAADSPEAANFRTALLNLHRRFDAELPKPAIKRPLDMGAVGLKVVKAVNPVTVLPRRARSFVTIPSSFKYLRPVETIAPVMAHPVFSDPMYKPLRDISAELLIPNLNLIPNNTITLLETNTDFIESYMVGLNHEMARELLSNRFFTDLRGTYFRQFWDVGEVINRDSSKEAETIEEELRDITPIHSWGKETKLGTHQNRPLPPLRQGSVGFSGQGRFIEEIPHGHHLRPESQMGG